MTAAGSAAPGPLRTCVGCRTKAAQATLRRFVSNGRGWEPDLARRRAPGRGAYLCSQACAGRVFKNKRYPGLGAAAGSVAW
jgi:predicted RNA-binding protein YlxR (DUF448 family)